MRHAPLAIRVVAILLLSACASNAGSSLPPSMSGAFNRIPLERRVERRALLGEANKTAKLYVSDPSDNKVEIYDLTGKNQKPVGALTTGISGPAGMATDAAGNLYVANTIGNTVTEYARGSGDPVTTYSEDLLGPVDVGVDSKGTVCVANFYSFVDSIVEFPAGSATPSLTIRNPGSSYPIALTLDAKDNLYVTYASLYLAPEVYAYTPGSKKGTQRVLNFGASSSGKPSYFVAGLRFDKNSNLLVAVGSLPGIDVFPPTKDAPSRVFDKQGSPQLLQFASDESDVFVADTEKHAVEEYTYPGGQLVDTITNGLKSVYGVAVGPGSVR